MAFRRALTVGDTEVTAPGIPRVWQSTIPDGTEFTVDEDEAYPGYHRCHSHIYPELCGLTHVSEFRWVGEN